MISCSDDKTQRARIVSVYSEVLADAANERASSTASYLLGSLDTLLTEGPLHSKVQRLNVFAGYGIIQSLDQVDPALNPCPQVRLRLIP